MPEGGKVVVKNRKARHDYFVESTFEAGLSLVGTEVKSIRMGSANLKDSYCAFQGGELFANNLHISPYEKGNIFNRDPMRPKKLLMHKRELFRLQAEVSREGLSLIPLSLYLKQGRVKMELGLCRGKKLYDKRDTAAKRDAQREIDRTMREKQK